MKRIALVLVGTLGPSPGSPPVALPVAEANAITTPAGTVADGVLTLQLAATLSMWYPDGDSLPGIPVEAFAEVGKALQVPGPLIRVASGAERRVSIRNTLSKNTITFSVDIGDAADSVVMPPGDSGALRVRPARAGTFFYRATTSPTLGRGVGVSGLLAGAVVLNSAATSRPPRDRIFVLQVATDGQIAPIGVPRYAQSVWAINGRSWPDTERFDAVVGDTLHWRVINIGRDPRGLSAIRLGFPGRLFRLPVQELGRPVALPP